MIIHVKQACEFVSRDGEKFNCSNGFVGIAPEWVSHDDYFNALCHDGLITAHVDNKGAEVEAEKAESGRRKKS